MVFVDLRNAYDTVHRKQLWKAMMEIGIIQGLIEAAKKLYNHNTLRVKTGNKYSKGFKTTEGLLQRTRILKKWSANKPREDRIVNNRTRSSKNLENKEIKGTEI